MQDLMIWSALSDIPAPQRQPYIQAFSDINSAWIKRYFVLEEKDKKTLGDPETYVLNAGGDVLFGCIHNTVAVTCSLLKINDDLYELSKMGVAEAYKGQGLASLLVPQAIATATRMGAKTLFLESNRRLTNALAIYERHGFKEVPMQDTPYARADIRMEITL